MDHVLAKIAGRLEEYAKLLSDQPLYNRPENLQNSVKYNAGYKLEEDEWYSVEELSKRTFCIEILKNPVDSTDYCSVEKSMLEKIEYICSYQQENEFYFQRVYKKRRLTKRKIIDFSGDLKLDETGEGIIVNEIPDALYIKSEDRLYFQKLETISPIFKGIENLYREATQREVDEFLNREFIKMDGGYTVDKVGKANRHRLAMAMDTLAGLGHEQQNELFQYTDEYYPGLEYDGKSFTIRTEEDLKNLLFGIEQRYYTTPVTHEKRVANSVQKIER